MNETAQIIIAIGTAAAAVLGAIASLIGTLVSLRNSSKLKENHANLATMREEINGKSDQLLETTRIAAHAAGVLQQKNLDEAIRSFDAKRNIFNT